MIQHLIKKVAKVIECKVNGKDKNIQLTENDLVFITNGSCVEGTIYGDQDHAPQGDAKVAKKLVVGIYGKILLNKMLHLDILKNSVVILKKQIGNQLQLQH